MLGCIVGKGRCIDGKVDCIDGCIDGKGPLNEAGGGTRRGGGGRDWGAGGGYIYCCMTGGLPCIGTCTGGRPGGGIEGGGEIKGGPIILRGGGAAGTGRNCGVSPPGLYILIHSNSEHRKISSLRPTVCLLHPHAIFKRSEETQNVE